MNFLEGTIKNMQKSELKPEDTFHFECKMCGNCCRKRNEPIPLTGADVYRIASVLNVSMRQVVEDYTTGYLGDTTHLPVIVLRERLDGSCSLLRKGRCMAHQTKPIACALFPLGRFYSFEERQFHYFMQPGACPVGSKDGKPWTLKEWLNIFHIRESEGMSQAWSRLVGGLGMVTCKIKQDQINGPLMDTLLDALFLGYTTDRPYVEQVEEHMIALKDFFRQRLHKNLNFD